MCQKFIAPLFALDPRSYIYSIWFYDTRVKQSAISYNEEKEETFYSLLYLIRALLAPIVAVNCEIINVAINHPKINFSKLRTSIS